MTRAVRLLDGILEGGVLALLLFAPVPYGSVQPWAQLVIAGGVALLVALVIVRAALSGRAAVHGTPLAWPAAAMAGLVGWQLLSAGASVNPPATWESARLYAAYLGLLLVLSVLPLTRARVARLMVVLVGWAMVLAGVGFARRLGLPVPGSADLDASTRLTSTFVNPNHQALFFALALFVAVGLLLRPAARRSRDAGGTRPGPSRGPAASLGARVLLAGGSLVLALALVLTLSRGGIVGAAAGFLAMLALALGSRARSRAVLPILAVVFGVTVYAGWVGLEAVAERFAVTVREPESDLRWRVWQATLGVVGDAPVAGVGLGAFQDGFSPHRPAEVPAENMVDYAHNDFLQLLAETGIVGLLIALWALAALLTFTVRRWGDRRDPFVRGLVLGGLGAVVAAMVHSLVDFGLHMPANALVLVVLAALLPLVVTLHHDGTRERVGLARWSVPLSARGRALGAAAAALLLAVAATLLVPPGMAEWHRARAAGIIRGARQAGGVPTQGDLVGARDELRRAVGWYRWSPAGWAELGEVSAQLAGRAWTYGLAPTGQRAAGPGVAARFRAAEPLLAEAYDAYRTALRLRPRAGELHERLGRFLGGMEGIRLALRRDGVEGPIDARLASLLGSDRGALPDALAHFQEAVRWDPQNALYHRSLGLVALGGGDPGNGQDVAGAALRRALTLRPDLLPGVLDELLARRVDDRVLLSAVPRTFEVVLELARELDGRGKPRAAVAAFAEAIELAATPAEEVQARLAHARALLERQDPSGALEQARHALVLAPREAEVFAVLATIHARANRGAEAETALATAVALAESGPAPRRNRFRGELAALFVQRGQWDRASALWRQVLREAPNDAWAHLELGRVLEQRGDAAGALHEFRTASAVGGDDGSLHWAVARALRDGGYLREAVGSYETARRLQPAEGDLGVELGDLYLRIGLEEQAIDQYRAVLGREPHHAGARRGLASTKAGTRS